MSQKVRLWTIQDYRFYEKLEQNGSLYFSDQTLLDQDPRFEHGYRWLMEQMNIKIGQPPSFDCYPLWAWYQWSSSTKMKPDLRYSAHLPKGAHGVRLEIIKDIKDILLSDFELWHYPYCYKSFIPKNKKDEQHMEELIQIENLTDSHFFEYPAHIRELIQKSWENIFDLNYSNSEYSYPPHKKRIQATFWSLHIDEVNKVQKFIAR